MPVSHEHLNTNVQIWDGERYSIMDKGMAEAAEATGKIQITTNLSSMQLLTKKELVARARSQNKEATTTSKKKRGGAKYANKQMTTDE